MSQTGVILLPKHYYTFILSPPANPHIRDSHWNGLLVITAQILGIRLPDCKMVHTGLKWHIIGQSWPMHVNIYIRQKNRCSNLKPMMKKDIYDSQWAVDLCLSPKTVQILNFSPPLMAVWILYLDRHWRQYWFCTFERHWWQHGFWTSTATVGSTYFCTFEHHQW